MGWFDDWSGRAHAKRPACHALPGAMTAAGPARARRRAVALAGHRGDPGVPRAHLADQDPKVRAGALSALARTGHLGVHDVEDALSDPSPGVRKRACELSVRTPGASPAGCLADGDPVVVEAAAWALGERGERGALELLERTASTHEDPLCREAAVAALGAIGDRRAVPTILASLRDKAPIRRRAVIALAPFDGPEVDAALEGALQDRDWQVRQAAEDLLSDRRTL